MELTDKYQERLDATSHKGFRSWPDEGPLTWIDKNTAVYYKPAEIALIRKAAKYMGCDPVPLLCQPAVGYRILGHIDNGYSVEEACELFGQENRKGE